MPVLDKPLAFYQHIVRCVLCGKRVLGLESWKHAVVAWLMAQVAHPRRCCFTAVASIWLPCPQAKLSHRQLAKMHCSAQGRQLSVRGTAHTRRCATTGALPQPHALRHALLLLPCFATAANHRLIVEHNARLLLFAKLVPHGFILYQQVPAEDRIPADSRLHGSGASTPSALGVPAIGELSRVPGSSAWWRMALYYCENCDVRLSRGTCLPQGMGSSPTVGPPPAADIPVKRLRRPRAGSSWDASLPMDTQHTAAELYLAALSRAWLGESLAATDGAHSPSAWSEGPPSPRPVSSASNGSALRGRQSRGPVRPSSVFSLPAAPAIREVFGFLQHSSTVIPETGADVRRIALLVPAPLPIPELLREAPEEHEFEGKADDDADGCDSHIEETALPRHRSRTCSRDASYGSPPRSSPTAPAEVPHLASSCCDPARLQSAAVAAYGKRDTITWCARAPPGTGGGRSPALLDPLREALRASAAAERSSRSRVSTGRPAAKSISSRTSRASVDDACSLASYGSVRSEDARTSCHSAPTTLVGDARRRVAAAARRTGTNAALVVDGVSDMCVLASALPVWETGSTLSQMSVPFLGDRVAAASTRNFQVRLAQLHASPQDACAGIVDDSVWSSVSSWRPGQSSAHSTAAGEPVLQFGKMRNNVYSCDFRWPISPIQAFCTLLSSFTWDVNSKSHK